jgi:hypothetical protein
MINYSIVKGNYRFEINQDDNNRFVNIFYKNNNLIIKFTDNFINENYFIRTIKNSQFHFKNNKNVITIKDKKKKILNLLI